MLNKGIYCGIFNIVAMLNKGICCGIFNIVAMLKKGIRPGIFYGSNSVDFVGVNEA
jgi:hypothetical protein